MVDECDTDVGFGSCNKILMNTCLLFWRYHLASCLEAGSLTTLLIPSTAQLVFSAGSSCAWIIVALPWQSVG